MRGTCSILSDITGLIRSPHASFLPLSIIFAPGSGPSPGRSRWEIMQADNASRQSITLMARTTMPRRFRTNFRLLQLSICTRGSQPERRKRKGGGGTCERADTCVFFPRYWHSAGFTGCFRQLLNTMMKLRALPPSNRQAIR